MTSFDKLDYVLTFMGKYLDGHYMSILEINAYGEVSKKMHINEIPSILGKLAKDGYLDIEIAESKDPLFESDKKYMITFEGKLLNESGGYRYKARRDAISTNLQLAQTWAISLGTALAGLYALYQIVIALTAACR